MRRIRLVVLAAIAALAAIPVALAFAASAAPTAASSPASNITNTGATLNGSINPNATPTQYAFQYGPTSSYGEETPITSGGAAGSPSGVSANVGSLTSGTTYHFRLIAINGGGTAAGNDETFKTTGTAPAPTNAPAPTATSTAASNVGNGVATLNGTTNPDGQNANYWFEWGPTSNYGFQTPVVSIGAPTSNVAVSAQIGNLTPNSTYHYRLVTASAGGLSLGADATLTTVVAPTVTTTSASDPTYGAATLNGSVNPQGNSTQYYFQYGSTTTYGIQTAPQDAGSGTTPVSINTRVTGLTPSTTYHYRLVAVSAGGTVYGVDQTVTTTAAVSTVSLMGHMGFVSPGYVVGVEIGCFGPSPCQGTFKASVGGAVIGTGAFTQNAQTGGFRNIKLNARGIELLRGNHPNHLLNVNVLVSVNGGQTINGSLSFATWYWKDLFAH